MDGSDYLLTCAEVGAALAGFSALVVAIRQRSEQPLAPFYRRLVAVLIERGLLATFFSLLPVLLEGLGVTAGMLWFSSSISLAAYGGLMAWRSLVVPRDPEARKLISVPAYFGLMLVGMLVLGLQIANAFGIGLTQSVWWYSIGVTWLLASAGYLFFFVILDWTRAA